MARHARFEVGVDEHHHCISKFLGHGELDLVELRTLHFGSVGLAQIVRSMPKQLVDFLWV